MTLTVDSDLNGESPQFTLTCTSTGGPATTVTWTRDSETVSGGMTVLNDPVTAQYTHTLTVTGRLGGQYQCTVSNNKPSQDSAQLTVAGSACGNKLYVHIVCTASPSPSPRPSLWPDCLSEWAGQCTSFLDSSIRRSRCDWLHHLLPAGGKREVLSECWGQ